MVPTTQDHLAEPKIIRDLDPRIEAKGLGVESWCRRVPGVDSEPFLAFEHDVETHGDCQHDQDGGEEA